MEDCVSVVLVFLTAEKIGLIFNFIGTLMVAASFGKNLGEGYQIDSSGNKVYLASFLYPRLLPPLPGIPGVIDPFICRTEQNDRHNQDDRK